MASGNGTSDPVLVIVQLTGGLDFMNTLIPYTEGTYYDSRPHVGIPQDQVLPLAEDSPLGFHPAAARLKGLFDDGDVAIVQGIGYPNSSRSHFRGMDIWHTCEPDKISTEGWIAKLVRELDPGSVNPLTAVSFGRGLPRACAAPGVTVTSVGDLDAYGLMTSIEQEQEREANLDLFRRMYTPAVGAGLVRDYLGQTGRDVLAGADVLAEVPGQYSTTVEWGTNPIATALRDVSRVHTAGLGTRVFYTQHAGYDYHSHQPGNHDRLLGELCGALSDFLTDLRNHDAADNVSVLVFTEFGRRIKDNGSGTDHGSGGGAYILGEQVQGGLYAEYPSVKPKDWLNGEDLKHTIDFRGIYGTMLEQWMGVEAAPIVGGDFEQVRPFTTAAA
ncbi:MAG: DUF1501 domain-containing protein [Dehalococcoidia bacterium]|nr:DUF1501 domain-containing protein [Dehalococcoidia bacterium]MYD29034.1 DUF1501 domain-containing protein [Dehalococcoidia bacterium]